MRCQMLLSIAILSCVLLPAEGQQQKKSPKAREAFVDPIKAGPDFAVQGEYEGKIERRTNLGAQVVAQGEGKFQVVFFAGGLPGAGWDGKTRVLCTARTESSGTTLEGNDWTGSIASGKLQGKNDKGESFTLTRITRQSPTLGARPPDGALVLFDGSKVDPWRNGKLVEDNLLTMGVSTTKEFKDFKLHLEFRLPYMPYARGQQRGNSGVYFQGAYEIQVLDSFGLEGKNNECGGIYRRKAPDVNMCYPPLSWQTLDIDYKAAYLDDKGEIVYPVVTIHHNGALIHDKVTIDGPTSRLGKPSAKPGPIALQNHGCPVYYRNIWLVEK